MLIYPSIEKLLYYAEEHLLLDELDVVFARNLILDELKLSDYVEYEIDYEAVESLDTPVSVLEPLVAYAIENGIISSDKAEYFADKLMCIVTKRPAEIADLFYAQHAKSPSKALEWLYDYSIKSNYVKMSQIQKNIYWEAKATRGRIEVSINLARPEKNNKQIATEVQDKKQTKKYPDCNICIENEGYAHGTQVRKTLRTIPLVLDGEDWFWQYSPYAYFNHHGIAVSKEHKPMKIDKSTITKLFDFVDFAPHYFIGSNAALPIVGGSILSHEHFQGGHKSLPMHKAAISKKIKSSTHPYIQMGIVDWYNSVIRLSYTGREQLITVADEIITAWSNYSDESVGIVAKTDAQHNAVTVIARKGTEGKYILDLILRNNRTTDEFPEGIFHSHPEFFPIKSESIGLIEAMGLFILPGRLDDQLKRIEKFLTKEVKYSAAKLDEDLVPFKDIIERLIKETGSGKTSAIEAQLILKDEINRVCEGILYNTAVFKNDEVGQAAFDKFLKTLSISTVS